MTTPTRRRNSAPPIEPSTRAELIAQLQNFAADADRQCTAVADWMSQNLLGDPVAVNNARRGRELLGQVRGHFRVAASLLEERQP